MVDISKSDADPRALRRAQNAEAQRRRRADRIRAEEENNQRRSRLNESGVREHEAAHRAAARARRTFDMARKYVNGNYIFHQPCGLWNEPSVQAVSYTHLTLPTKA